MYRDVPQHAYEIQEMTETPSREQNGQPRNGTNTQPKGGTLTKGKAKRPDSDSSDNGLLYDDDMDDDYVDHEVARGERIRNTVICVVVLLIVVGAVIALVVTLSGKKSKPLGVLHADDINYTHTVYLNCTPLRGIIEHEVYIFKGIPYATSKRWRESESLESSEGGCYVDDILEADEYGSKCYQYDQEFQDYGGSEDCLFLNVWTPSLGNESALPVMVYFHGGGLMVGSGGEHGASPNALVAKETNMVYVSFNYRLNAFGFLSLDLFGKQENKSQGLQGNFGLQDQIMALKWVQKNIHQLGGDPGKVTVFGQGSGATSILALMTIPQTKGLYHRAWLMSPSPKFEDNTREDVKPQNRQVLNNTRCPTDSNNDEELLNCLEETPPASVVRALPWKKWMNLHFRSLPETDEQSTILAIIDGKLVTKSLIQALKEATAVDVPLLIGNMAQEVDDEATPRNLSKWSWDEYSGYVRTKLPAHYQKLLEYYPLKQHTPELQLTSMVSDMRAICPMAEVTKVAANKTKSKVYRYVMSYFPTKNASMQNYTRNYAFSGLDMYVFFGSYDKISGYASKLDSQLTSYLRGKVSDFARNGEIKDKLWGPFPHTTTVIANTHKNLDSGYKEAICGFLRTNALFPQYAWMN